jgi:uncharacterized protein YggE
MRILILAASIIFSSISVYAQNKNFIDQPYIEVNGKADTSVIPDRIYMGIKIYERDSKGKVPLAESESAMIAGLKKLGIDTEMDLSVSDMTSNFRFYALKKTDVFTSREYILLVRDASTAMKVINELEQMGISNVSIDKVEYSEIDLIKNLVREKAVNKARDKANFLVRSLKQNIGNAIHIVDNEDEVLNMLQGKVAGVSIRGYDTMRDKAEQPKIEFEKIKVTSTVNVKFVLK